MATLPNQPGAVWFPSRRRFALGKLLAFAALQRHCARRSLPQAPEESIGSQQSVIAIERDHDAFEIFSVAILYFVVTTSFVASRIPWPLPFSVILAALFQPLVSLIVCFMTSAILKLSGTAWRKRDPDDFRDENGAVLMALAGAASLHLVVHHGWARPIGALFLTIVAINALASIVVRFLRNAMAGLEERCVA